MKNAWVKWRAVGRVATCVALGLMIGGTLTSGKESQDSVAARLQKTEDRQAIEQLMMGDYPRALDSSNWKVYASFFAQDGELILGADSAKGPAAIEAYFNRPRAPRAGGAAAAPAAPAAPAGPRATKHVVTNLTVQLNGDRAAAQAYWQTVSSRNGSTVIAGAGHYEDMLKKESGVWKFARRAIITEPAPAAAGTASATPAAR
jgi:SnoaL-like domain